VKIKTLSLTDFRAFPGPAPTTFDLDGKNLLVYGENGSGKSSLFKALSGFFKYGTPPPRLRELKNSFSDQSLGNTSVNVTLDNEFTAAWRMQLLDEVSPYPSLRFAGPSLKEDHPTHRRTEPGMVEIEQAAKFSACLDYRTLLGTNYKHGHGAINLFDAMVWELLAGFVDLASNKTILELWLRVARSLPDRNSQSNRVTALLACNDFNEAMQRTLHVLLPEAQAVLKLLCPDGLELTNLPFAGVRYNGEKLKRDKAYVDKTIGLEIAYRGLPMERPQHYLNEARQSAIGLALYLGARMACAPQTSSHLKLLVLDDVLVGLDHSNRLPVLNVLVDCFPAWQVVLLTHDKGWFDLARQRLPNPDWVCYEIYEGDPTAMAPLPIVRKTQNRPAAALLDKADDLIKQGYYEAAANYVRQAFETGLRAACELKSIKLPYKQNVLDHQSQELLNGLKHWPGTATVPKTDWDAVLNKLELMKNVVMNPYSHPSAPNIPRQEVVEAADTVRKFLELARQK
jgi:energy-coupling factor transporter ATP-binding protein EcfA2/HEPN domain-containing protein